MATDRVIGLLSTVILARLLLPQDFGVVAMCMSVVAALELFAAFGFDVVLIQRQDAGRAHYDTAWTLRLIFGIAIAASIAVAAYPTSLYYNEPKVIYPMLAIAAGSLLRCFENIAVVDFRKKLKFRLEAIFRLSQRCTGFLVTVPLAFFWRDHWALVVGIIAMDFAAVLLSYLMAPRTPRLSLAECRDIMSFSSWLLVNNFVGFLRKRASYFVLGRVSSASGLGYLQLSQDLSNAFTRELVASANRAVFPGYSRISSNDEHIAEMFLRVVSLTSLFAVPVGIGLSVIAHLVVPIVLGSGWDAAVPLVQLFAINGALMAIASNCTYVFHARAKPRTATAINLLQVVILIPALLILVPMIGLVGVGWAMIMTSVISIPVAFLLAFREINSSPSELVYKLWRSITAGTVMGSVVLLHQQLFEPAPWLAILSSVGLGVGVYVGVLVVLVRFAGDGEHVERQALEYGVGFLKRAAHKLHRRPDRSGAAPATDSMP